MSEIIVKINANDDNNILIDGAKFKKLIFLYNALEEGWSVKKRKDSFIFTKNHEGKKEIFLETYLADFLKKNFDINNIMM